MVVVPVGEHLVPKMMETVVGSPSVQGHAALAVDHEEQQNAVFAVLAGEGISFACVLVMVVVVQFPGQTKVPPAVLARATAELSTEQAAGGLP